MATSGNIAQVRLNVNEPTEATYTDIYISDLIDELGVAGASAAIWTDKAAAAAELVNTTEAGASHSFSDLHKNALGMAKYFQDIANAQKPPSYERPRVHKIERTV